MPQEAKSLFEHWRKTTYWRRIWGRTGQLQEVAFESFFGIWELVEELSKGSMTTEALREHQIKYDKVLAVWERLCRIGPIERMNPSRLTQPNLARNWAGWSLECWKALLDVAEQKRGPGRPRKGE